MLMQLYPALLQSFQLNLYIVGDFVQDPVDAVSV